MLERELPSTPLMIKSIPGPRALRAAVATVMAASILTVASPAPASAVVIAHASPLQASAKPRGKKAPKKAATQNQADDSVA